MSAMPRAESVIYLVLGVVTVDTYGHLIPGANKAAVDRLDRAPICTPGAPTQRIENRCILEILGRTGDPSGTRTPDSLLKRQELYRLS